MNPGISIRFGNNATHKKARRTSEGNGRHFSYFGKIQNNLGGSPTSAATDAIACVEIR